MLAVGKNRTNVVARNRFCYPLGIVFPIQSTGDFFGQWNNIFMWSAIAIALAAARTLIPQEKIAVDLITLVL